MKKIYYAVHLLMFDTFSIHGNRSREKANIILKFILCKSDLHTMIVQQIKICILVPLLQSVGN